MFSGVKTPSYTVFLAELQVQWALLWLYFVFGMYEFEVLGTQILILGLLEDRKTVPLA